MSAPKSVVYGLCDPRTGELRYVGKTAQYLSSRLGQHKKRAAEGYKSHFYDWWRSLEREGVEPTCFVIEGGGDLVANESFYISYFRSVGCRLTNLTNGGEGALGYRHSPERRLKISRAKKGKKNPNHGLAMVRAGVKMPPEVETQAAALYLSGLSLRAVGEQIGWGEGSVLKALKRLGVPRRNSAEGRWLSTRSAA